MALSLEFLGFFYTAFLYAFNLYLLLFPEIPCLIASGCSSFRSSRPDVFYKKGVLRNFTKFTGKHLCQSLFFNKVAGLTPLCSDFVITDYWVLFDFVNYRNSKLLHICEIHLHFPKTTLNLETIFLRFLENLGFFILCFGLKEICAVRCSRSVLGTLKYVSWNFFLKN